MSEDVPAEQGLDAIMRDGEDLWQMTPGERIAVAGVLSLVRPRLAIEIGTARGASLRWIGRFAEEVHSFDMLEPSLSAPPNATLHTGDSHVLLPRFLAELAEAGRNVDFVVVDGDHASEGVARDLFDLLDSPAVGRTAIVIHDTGNEQVRRGIDAVPFAAWPKVSFVDLDFVPGHVGASEALRHELWWGLGLVVVDASRSAYFADSVLATTRHHHGEVLALARDALVGREAARAAAESEELGALRASEERLRARVTEVESFAVELQELTRFERERWDAAMGSVSWRVTAPLRAATDRVRRLRDG